MYVMETGECSMRGSRSEISTNSSITVLRELASRRLHFTKGKTGFTNAKETESTALLKSLFIFGPKFIKAPNDITEPYIKSISDGKIKKEEKGYKKSLSSSSPDIINVSDKGQQSKAPDEKSFHYGDSDDDGFYEQINCKIVLQNCPSASEVEPNSSVAEEVQSKTVSVLNEDPKPNEKKDLEVSSRDNYENKGETNGEVSHGKTSKLNAEISVDEGNPIESEDSHESDVETVCEDTRKSPKTAKPCDETIKGVPSDLDTLSPIMSLESQRRLLEQKLKGLCKLLKQYKLQIKKTLQSKNHSTTHTPNSLPVKPRNLTGRKAAVESSFLSRKIAVENKLKPKYLEFLKSLEAEVPSMHTKHKAKLSNCGSLKAESRASANLSREGDFLACSKNKQVPSNRGLKKQKHWHNRHQRGDWGNGKNNATICSPTSNTSSNYVKSRDLLKPKMKHGEKKDPLKTDHMSNLRNNSLKPLSRDATKTRSTLLKKHVTNKADVTDCQCSNKRKGVGKKAQPKNKYANKLLQTDEQFLDRQWDHPLHTSTTCKLEEKATIHDSCKHRAKQIPNKCKVSKHLYPSKKFSLHTLAENFEVFDPWNFLRSDTDLNNNNPLEVRVKCPHGLCEKTTDLIKFTWHMVSDHLNACNLFYARPEQEFSFSFNVSEIIWNVAKPLHIFMLKNEYKQLGALSYLEYFPVILMGTKTSLFEIGYPFFGEPICGEYYLLWFTGPVFPNSSIEIQILLENEVAYMDRSLNIYSIASVQNTANIYLSGSAMAIPTQYFNKLLNEDFTVPFEILVKK